MKIRKALKQSHCPSLCLSVCPYVRPSVPPNFSVNTRFVTITKKTFIVPLSNKILHNMKKRIDFKIILLSICMCAFIFVYQHLRKHFYLNIVKGGIQLKSFMWYMYM